MHEFYLLNSLNAAIDAHATITKIGRTRTLQLVDRLLFRNPCPFDGSTLSIQKSSPSYKSTQKNKKRINYEVVTSKITKKELKMVEDGCRDELRLTDDKIRTCGDLVNFRRETQEKFNSIRDSIGAGYYRTNNTQDSKIIKAHTAGGSLMNKYTAGQIKDYRKRGNEIIQRINNPSSFYFSKSEAECLQKLNAQGYSFVQNVDLFFKGSISGCPDAIMEIDDRVVGVAEFKDVRGGKPASQRSQKCKAIQQAAAYADVLSLEVAMVCIHYPDEIEIIVVNFSEKRAEIHQKVRLFELLIKNNFN